MNDADANDSPPSRLQAALLDYFSAPGKYQLSLREPALLFASIREILQLAAGRNAVGKDDARVREAAVFFVRAALLYPGADHYALLGFPLRAEPVDAKERYRLLMRLIHPDFATAGPVAWPADAAMRVNRAYEVLSSPVLRSEYDDQLAANLRPQRSPAAPVAAPARTSAAVRAPAAARRSREEATSARKKFGIAVAAGAALLAILLLLPHAEPDQLVQKLPPARPPEVRIARAEPPPEPVAPPPIVVASETSSSPVLRQEPVPVHAAPVPQPAAAAAAPVQQQAAQPLQVARTPAPLQQVAVPRAPVAVQPPPAARHPVPVAPVANAARPAAPAASHGLPAPIAEALAALSLRRAVASAPAPAAMPEPVVLVSPAPPAVAPVESRPAPAPAPASAAIVTVAAARPASSLAMTAPAPAPTLADAQPLLTQLLQMLETGNGEELLRLLDAKARQAPSARSLSHDYEQIVHGGRPVRVSQVEFRGETHDGVLLVTGRMRVHAGEPTIGSYGQKFLVRAEFVSRGGKTMLTGLSGAPD